MSKNTDQIVIFDIGARFGIHPSWRALAKSPACRYFAFDVDVEEVRRLERKYLRNPNYKVFHQGFSSVSETRVLNILAHRGQSSFHFPNMDSPWFGSARVEDSKIVEQRDQTLLRLDEWCYGNNLQPDFIKIDTEGYDLKILEGSRDILQDTLALRCEIFFEKNFEGAPLFSDLFGFLRDNNFRLGNIDYDGRGVPSSYFCPDPLKYGVLLGGEAVFLRSENAVRSMDLGAQIKYCIFCLLNNLSDVALPILLELVPQKPAANVSASIWLELKRLFCINGRKLLYSPGDGYIKIKKDFEKIFDEAFPDQHRFFESDFYHPE